MSEKFSRAIILRRARQVGAAACVILCMLRHIFAATLFEGDVHLCSKFHGAFSKGGQNLGIS